MPDQTTNAVRQILMNELGLSRESVRGIAAEIVQTTVQRQLENSAYLEKLVRSIVEDALRRPAGGEPWTDHLRKLVEGAAYRAAQDAVAARVTITVKEANRG